MSVKVGVIEAVCVGGSAVGVRVKVGVGEKVLVRVNDGVIVKVGVIDGVFVGVGEGTSASRSA